MAGFTQLEGKSKTGVRINIQLVMFFAWIYCKERELRSQK